jgi:hypothetical protein
MRNLQSKSLPSRKRGSLEPLAGVQGARRGCYQAASPALARLLRNNIATTYENQLPSAVACLDDDFEACITHLRFPAGPSPGDPHYQSARAAVRRGAAAHQEPALAKAGVIPHAFGERAALKLVYAALIRAAKRWRGIRITEFEQRQLRAIRDEIDRDFPAHNAPAGGATVAAAPTRLSSNDRT